MKATNIILIVVIIVAAVLAGLLVSSNNKLGSHNAIVKGYEERVSELEVAHNNMLDEKENLVQTIHDLEQKEKGLLKLQQQLYEIAEIASTNKKSTLANVELNPDRATDESLETLEKNQNELKKLRKERGQLYTEINALKKDLNSTDAKDKIQEQIDRLQAEIDRTDVMISNLEQSIAKSQDLIDSQRKELNTIYYVIGSKKELREMGVTSKEGGVLWGLLGATETVRNDFSQEKFTPKNLAENDEIEINSYIDRIVIHTKQLKSTYELVEVSRGITVLKIKDHEQFRKDKHLVIEIR
ncbi:MAG: hypothetical protein WC155_03055 [Candidatus Cloacimonadales bacterium]|jgi:hypothetical protein